VAFTFVDTTAVFCLRKIKKKIHKNILGTNFEGSNKKIPIFSYFLCARNM
jgi:hypothetical protein